MLSDSGMNTPHCSHFTMRSDTFVDVAEPVLRDEFFLIPLYSSHATTAANAMNNTFPMRVIPNDRHPRGRLT
jgi:hypothetical protein